MHYFARQLFFAGVVLLATLTMACSSGDDEDDSSGAGVGSSNCSAFASNGPQSEGNLTVEATFDDGPDHAGFEDCFQFPNNHEGIATLQFLNGARRTALGEGKYGRAARFAGGSSKQAIEIHLSSFSANKGLAFQAWVKPDSSSESGWLLLVQNSFGIHLNQGEIEIAVSTAGAMQHFRSGIKLHGASYQHVDVKYFPGKQQVIVMVDFLGEFVQKVPNVPASNNYPVLGEDFAGNIDEIILFADSQGRSLFDRNPTYCGDDPKISCREDVLTMFPEGWPHYEVPARFKTLWNPNLCNSQNPCPLLIDLSGGNQCNNDYDGEGEVTAFANAGYVVATGDPFCKFSPTDPWIKERVISQLVAVKNRLFDMNQQQGHPLEGILLDDPGDPGRHYFASGCSYGSTVGLNWALRDKVDFPKRFFARSGSATFHCPYHTTYCPDAQLEIDLRVLEVGFPHDDALPEVAKWHESFEAIDDIDSEIVVSREIGYVWGYEKDGGPICAEDGSTLCFEEGGGKTQSGRMVRDIWKSLESKTKPTGYFVENNTQNCQHCLSPNGVNKPIWDCMSGCFLRYGRELMPMMCPECLAPPLGSATFDEGGAAASCNIDCDPILGCTVL